jgi:hypothetical protein
MMTVLLMTNDDENGDQPPTHPSPSGTLLDDDNKGMDELSHNSLNSSSSRSILYQNKSIQELRVMKLRLESILGLFQLAQRQKESTNLRWQAQADFMKQDATSKYILYCNYGQI